jgi:hypothetical protein
MIVASLISALLLASAPADTPPQAAVALVQERPVVDPQTLPATDLEDIVVEGRRLDQAVETFVDTVSAPSRGRGLARWRGGVCIGVANLQNETAQYIVDRVSTVAEDVGLAIGEPGCHPSILIVATADGDAFTPGFVAMRPRLFRVGGTGMDRGAEALEKFKTNGRPVRWWTVSVPVDDDTGQIAVRIPGMLLGGQDNGSRDTPTNSLYAPNVARFSASRLRTEIVDDAKRSFVIVDVSRTENVSLAQLADYIALVSLAQIDPDADTSGYATILNVFDDPTRTEGLTNWDHAYLNGLYGATRKLSNRNSHLAEVSSAIVRAHHDLADAEDDTAPE